MSCNKVVLSDTMKNMISPIQSVVPSPIFGGLTSVSISSLTTHGRPNEAIKVYASLRACGIKPHSSVFLAVAKACAVSGDALRVKEVHDDATRLGVMSDVFIANALIHAY
ncbi:pentatricopeptide repeat-containing protein, partial [Trifolium medium]|nr:pentatricopeptide repeat-containing protein [Trifolium medium]